MSSLCNQMKKKCFLPSLKIVRNQLLFPRVVPHFSRLNEIKTMVYSRLEKSFLDKCEICTLYEVLI